MCDGEKKLRTPVSKTCLFPVYIENFRNFLWFDVMDGTIESQLRWQPSHVLTIFWELNIWCSWIQRSLWESASQFVIYHLRFLQLDIYVAFPKAEKGRTASVTCTFVTFLETIVFVTYLQIYLWFILWCSNFLKLVVNKFDSIFPWPFEGHIRMMGSSLDSVMMMKLISWNVGHPRCLRTLSTLGQSV